MANDPTGNDVLRMLLRKKDKISYIRHDTAFSGHVRQLDSGFDHFYLGRNTYAIGEEWRNRDNPRLYILTSGTHSSAFSEWELILANTSLVQTLLPYIEAKKNAGRDAARKATLVKALS